LLTLQIEFPLPDAKTKRRIFGIHTSRMTLSEDVNLEEFVMAKVSRSTTAQGAGLTTFHVPDVAGAHVV
jgi:ATP-dependent 26S proteasome regulatory subunit